MLFVAVYHSHLKYVDEVCHGKVLGATPVNKLLCRQTLTLRPFEERGHLILAGAHTGYAVHTAAPLCGFQMTTSCFCNPGITQQL